MLRPSADDNVVLVELGLVGERVPEREPPVRPLSR